MEDGYDTTPADMVLVAVDTFYDDQIRATSNGAHGPLIFIDAVSPVVAYGCTM